MSPPQQSSAMPRVGMTDTGDYYIHNEAAIREIARHVSQDYYCAILGPRYCQKSLLLKDVKARLIGEGALCILLDLAELATVADGEFLASFAAMLGQRIPVSGLQASSAITDALYLQRFLQDYVEQLRWDLVLLIDHLECIRIGPLTSLLQALRAVYTRASPNDPYRLGVVTASSLSVANLALGPTSPFNIARLVWIRDLTPAESEPLIEHILQQKGIKFTPDSLQRLIQATNGDRSLILKLCDRCARLATEQQKKGITEQEVNETIDWFVREKTGLYPLLRETVRALEDNPVSLMNILKVLEQGQVPHHELRLGREAEVDDLQLTGAVRTEEIKDEKIYLIHNEIYARYLKQHFHPDRIVHVLRMAGRWEEAIHYLERLITGSPQYRSTLLGAVIDSIYTARSESSAYKGLAQRLCQTFAIPRVGLYIANPERSRLELVSQVGFEEGQREQLSLGENDQPEVEAYFSQHYEVVQSASGEQPLFIPLLRDDREPLGIVAIYGFKADPQGDDFLELLAFLKQVGRAIGNIIDRERRLRQLTILNETGKQVTSSPDLQQTLSTTVDAAIQAVPGAQRSVLYLWDEEEQKLLVRAQRG